MAAIVRSATLADRPALEIIRRQAIEASLSERYDRGRFAALVAEPDAELAEWLETDRYLALVVETSVTPVAYAVGDLQAGELLALYTAPDYQGRGYATQLLERIQERMAASAAPSLDVWTLEPAVDFFRASGFVTADERTESPVPRVRLRKHLGEDG